MLSADFVTRVACHQIAATFTNPFDVVKTRRQALDSSALSAEAIAAGEKPPVQLTKTFPILMDIYHKEGMAGLMRGLTPRLAKVSLIARRGSIELLLTLMHFLTFFVPANRSVPRVA